MLVPGTRVPVQASCGDCDETTVYFIVLDPPEVAGPPCTFFSRWHQTPNNFLDIDKVTCYNSDFCGGN